MGVVGRESEQHSLRRLLAAARLGQSGVLVLRGEAGIGKSALLDDTADRAGDMTTLRVYGSEGESTLSFSGVHQLLRPALHLIDRLPAPQEEALAVALMLRQGPPPQRFAVGAATLNLLSRFAEGHPLLILVDDAHLLDPPSAEALAFTARRLLADPIAVLISLRPDPDTRFAAEDFPIADLEGLDLASTSILLAANSPAPPTAEVTAQLHHATSGNPLALLELARDVDKLARSTPEIPIPLPQRLARAFGRRITALPAATRSALLTVAVADGDLSVAAGALGAGVEHLAAAEACGLLSIASGRATFRHPLVRSAIYAEATPEDRRVSHRAVSAALPPSMLDRRVWHRSAACVGPDADVADDLVALAARASARGAAGVAALALARSAELSASHTLRGTRLTAAGEAAWLAGRTDQASEFLEQAAQLVSEVTDLAEIDGLRGAIALRAGSLRSAFELLTRASGRTEASDPDLAVQLLADALTACFYLCDTESGFAVAQHLSSILERCGEVARIRGQMAVGITQVLGGIDGVPLIRAAVEALTTDPDQLDDPRRPDWMVIGTLFLRESGTGRGLVEQVVRDRRARTALGALPNLLFHTSRDDATTDRWDSALIGYAESIGLARESGQSTDLATSLAGLAWLQARIGRSDECRANAQEAAALAERHDIVFAGVWAQFALGDLALALGDAPAAVTRYRELRETLHRVGFRDIDVDPGPELTEAQLRTGRIDDARQTAAEYLRRALAKGQPWAVARAHRACAMAETDPAAQHQHFEEALLTHRSSADTYEEARTRLAYGAALRRAKQRVAARPQLEAALSAFNRLGAAPWSEAAATELEATGARARRVGDSRASVLTPQEMQIARLLGDGASTREAAAALFLSPKTVEYHLRHVYQKLGIGSRTELTAAMSEN